MIRVVHSHEEPALQTARLAPCLSLVDLPAGTEGCLDAAELNPRDRAVLAALGLRDGCRVRVCKRGSPCILKVQNTRVGLCRQLARQLRVRVLAALAG